MMLLNKFNAASRDDAYVVDSRINNLKDLAIIGKLLELPSFVINRADICKGFLNIYSRFHSSQIDAVSDLLAQYTSDSENSRVEWLGPSPGLMYVMDLINSEYPISVVTFDVSLHGDEKRGDHCRRTLNYWGIEEQPEQGRPHEIHSIFGSPYTYAHNRP